MVIDDPLKQPMQTPMPSEIVTTYTLAQLSCPPEPAFPPSVSGENSIVIVGGANQAHWELGEAVTKVRSQVVRGTAVNAHQDTFWTDVPG